jgi:hypothetical protein
MEHMNVQLVIQYTTLFSVLTGALSLAVAVVLHREQLKTQIFLALSARYDELLHNCSPDLWLDTSPDLRPDQRTDDLTVSALRYCTLISVAYALFRESRIPDRMWHLMLHSAERRLRSPLFVREWEHLRPEFESFPEFIVLVASVQQKDANPR